MRTDYGTTWWGQQWLNALSRIDLENRIPRGKSYANNGKVTSFKISPKKKEITAKVKGQYRPSYTVKLRMPEISDYQKNLLIERISKSPLILSKLAARELDPEVLKIAESCGIQLFPKQWSDMDMSCTCPDYAVPCKHLAAAVYITSQEIDSNPFVVFEMRGIDLIKELEKRGVQIGRAKKAEVPTWSEVLTTPSTTFLEDEFEETEEEKAAEKTEATELKTIEVPEDEPNWLKELGRLSFENIDFDAKAMVDLLEDRPAGYVYGNLKEQYANALGTAAKLAKAQITNISERTPPTWDASIPFLVINSTGWPTPNESISWKEYLPHKEQLNWIRIGEEGRDEIKVRLHNIFSGYSNTKRLAESPESIEALYYIWVIATKLVMASAIEPLLFVPREGYMRVQWFPSQKSEQLAKLVEKVGELAKNLPSDFFVIDGEDGEKKEEIPASIVGELILGAFIESYIDSAYDTITKKKPYQSLEEDILFGPYSAEMAVEPQLETIKLRLAEWLSPLGKTFGDIRPVLTIHDPIEERAEDAEEALDRPVSLELGFYLNDTSKKKAGSTKQRELVPLNKALTQKKWASKRFDVMQLTARLARYCSDLNELLKNNGKNADLKMEQLTRLLFESLPTLKLLGVKVALPRSLRRLLKPQARLSVSGSSSNRNNSFFDFASLLDFDWKIALGDRDISIKEFEELTRHAGKIVRFHDSFMYMNVDMINRIRKQLDSRNSNLTKSALIRGILTGKVNDWDVHLSENVQKALAELLNNDDIAVPETLTATLRPYQERGYSWLMRNYKIGLGSILADDMGLGKTVQVIGFLDELRNDGILKKNPALIVVPKTLIVNWQKELEKFAPELKAKVFYGSGRSTDLKADLKDQHLIITTYGTLRSSIDILKKIKFSALVLDEAQAIKNVKTATAEAVKQIKRQACIAMSGTPVENRLGEYWSIMEATNPGLLGTTTQFQKEYASPIEVERNIEVAERFKKLTSPFIMRRLKTDKNVITDLPEKITQDEFCTLTKEQAALYKARVDKDLKDIFEQAPGQRNAKVLQLMLNLKQICNSPVNYESNSPYNKPDDAGKMERVLEILEEMREAGRKVLIFTQFRQMGFILQDWIEEKTGKRPLFIHGGTEKRQEIVDEFQNDRSHQVMILSLKAAGTGLNITAASAVIHYDLWWNPAVEEQATDRAYRIGQKHNVNVYRMITADTFEEKINEMIESKKALAELTVSTGENWIGQLSNDELKEVFALREG